VQTVLQCKDVVFANPLREMEGLCSSTVTEHAVRNLEEVERKMSEGGGRYYHIQGCVTDQRTNNSCLEPNQEIYGNKILPFHNFSSPKNPITSTIFIILYFIYLWLTINLLRIFIFIFYFHTSCLTFVKSGLFRWFKYCILYLCKTPWKKRLFSIK